MAADDSVGIEVDADASGGVSAFDSMGESAQAFIDKMNVLPNSFHQAATASQDLSEAQNSAAISHRALHQTMSMVGVDLVAMSGASAALDGPVHVLSSSLMALVMAGGAISAPFLIGTAAMVGLTTVLGLAKKGTKEQSESSEDLLHKSESLASTTDSLLQKLTAYSKLAGSDMPSALRALLGETQALDAAEMAQASHLAGVAMGAAQSKLTAEKADASAIREKIAELIPMVALEAQEVATGERAAGTTKIHANELKNLNDQLAANTVDQIKQQGVINTATADITAYSRGVNGASALIDKETEALKAHQKAVKKDAEENATAITEAISLLQKDEAAANKAGAAFSKMARANIDKTSEITEATAAMANKLNEIPAKYSRMTIEANRYFDNEVARVNASAATTDQKGNQILQIEQQRTARIAAIDNQETQAKINNVNKLLGVETNANAAMLSSASSAFIGIRSGFSNSVASMIVEGKNFSQSMHQVFISVAEQAIAKLIEIEVVDRAVNLARQGYAIITGATQTVAAEEAAVTTLATDKIIKTHEAITSGGLAVLNAMQFGALAGPVGSAAAGATETGIIAGPMGVAMAAQGIDFLADRPTMVQVGEGGETERVTVTPMSQSGAKSAGGAGAMVFNFGDIIIQGITDPQRLADEIALLISQSIRGRGQVSLIGKSIW